MHIGTYLKAKKLTGLKFAELLGGVSKHAIRKWRSGERLPDIATAVRIEQITGGAVTVHDWVKPRPATAPAPSPTNHTGDQAA